MAVEHTGGMTVQTDTFTNPVFRDSFKRVFAKPGEDGHMAIASNATFEVTAAPARVATVLCTTSALSAPAEGLVSMLLRSAVRGSSRVPSHLSVAVLMPSLNIACRSVQIIPSRDVKVAGLLGPASPVEKKGMSVAETPVGLGGTTQW